MGFSSKTTQLILFFLLSVNLSAQVPIPQLCAVTIDTSTHKPVILWHIDDSTKVDGYIIKRVIYDGSGVVSGTLNNIAIVEKNTDTSFIDTTTVYQTSAKPWLRAETYVVAAFENQNGTISYSGFSNFVKSIHLKCQINLCGDQIVLTWNSPNITVNNYQIYLRNNDSLIGQTKDSFFVYTPTISGNFSFYVKANIQTQCATTEVFSNIDTIALQQSVTPKELYIESISAAENGLEILLHITPRDETPFVFLYRDGQNIATFEEAFDGKYLDTVEQTKEHEYQLIAKDLCGQISLKSNKAKNIVLSGESLGQNFTRYNKLFWSEYDYWSGQTDRYELWYGSDSTQLSMLQTTKDTSYTHALLALINSTEVKPNFYYQITAYEKNNPKGFHGVSKSNILQLTQEPLMIVPNSIIPNSTVEGQNYIQFFCNFYDQCQFTIKDQYGHTVFHTSIPTDRWYGKLPDGSSAPEGTYIYMLKVKSSGKTYRKRGYINLFYLK